MRDRHSSRHPRPEMIPHFSPKWRMPNRLSVRCLCSSIIWSIFFVSCLRLQSPVAQLFRCVFAPAVGILRHFVFAAFRLCVSYSSASRQFSLHLLRAQTLCFFSRLSLLYLFVLNIVSFFKKIVSFEKFPFENLSSLIFYLSFPSFPFESFILPSTLPFVHSSLLPSFHPSFRLFVSPSFLPPFFCLPFSSLLLSIAIGYGSILSIFQTTTL